MTRRKTTKKNLYSKKPLSELEALYNTILSKITSAENDLLAFNNALANAEKYFRFKETQILQLLELQRKNQSKIADIRQKHVHNKYSFGIFYSGQELDKEAYDREVQPIYKENANITSNIESIKQQAPKPYGEIYFTKAIDFLGRSFPSGTILDSKFYEYQNGQREILYQVAYNHFHHNDLSAGGYYYLTFEQKKIALEIALTSLQKESRQLATEIRRRQKSQQQKGMLAAYTGKSRQIAKMIKKQLLESDNCPYCTREIGQNPHADHIYPVSHGGLSTVANMIIICADCNQKKGDLTLREFIEKHNLDRSAIETYLTLHKKKF